MTVFSAIDFEMAMSSYACVGGREQTIGKYCQLN